MRRKLRSTKNRCAALPKSKRQGDNYLNSHRLRVYMGNLRQKLEHDPAQPAYLVTETGAGYRLAGVE